MSEYTFRRIVAFASITIIVVGSFWAGKLVTGYELQAAADAMVADPTNTFTKCLTEGWEATGALPPEWRAERQWHLVPPHPTP